jgi:hypothetical protein
MFALLLVLLLLLLEVMILVALLRPNKICCPKSASLVSFEVMEAKGFSTSVAQCGELGSFSGVEGIVLGVDGTVMGGARTKGAPARLKGASGCREYGKKGITAVTLRAEAVLQA